MRRRWTLPLLTLLLSLALLLTAALRSEAALSPAALPGGGRAALLLPRDGQEEPAPAVLLLWTDGAERLRSWEIAVELCRRGYAALIAPASDAPAAWEALGADPRLRHGALGALAWEGGRDALTALSAAEAHPRALLYMGAAEESGPHGLAGNVLCILQGEADEAGRTEGIFAEGGAHRTVTLRPRRAADWQRAALPYVLDWVGSSLGRPRDGVYPDGEFVFPQCRALLLAAALCLLLSLPTLLLALWKRPRRPGEGA